MVEAPPALTPPANATSIGNRAAPSPVGLMMSRAAGKSHRHGKGLIGGDPLPQKQEAEEDREDRADLIEHGCIGEDQVVHRIKIADHADGAQHRSGSQRRPGTGIHPDRGAVPQAACLPPEDPPPDCGKRTFCIDGTSPDSRTNTPISAKKTPTK